MVLRGACGFVGGECRRSQSGALAWFFSDAQGGPRVFGHFCLGRFNNFRVWQWFGGSARGNWGRVKRLAGWGVTLRRGSVANAGVAIGRFFSGGSFCFDASFIFWGVSSGRVARLGGVAVGE